MKTTKTHSILIAFLLLISFSASARVWRVNNQSNYNGTSQWGENYGGVANVYPVFKQVNQALAWNAFNPGDTIHVEGSSIVYDGATLNKKAIIIGSGYFLEQNPNVSNNTYDSKIASFHFETGSENSIVMGMNIVFNGFNTQGTAYLNVNSITVKRCRIERGIAFATQLSEAFILQNFFVFLNGGNMLYTNGFNTFVPPNELIFNNNICQNKLIWKNATTVWNILQCHNNIFDGPANVLNLEFNSGSFRNNILKGNGITATINQGTNNNISHNTVSTAGVLSGSADILVVPNMSSLFVASGSIDGLYQLQAASASNVNGIDGTPRGAFGGIAETNRYTLSGLAAIPVIYQTTTSGVAVPGNNLTVQIKARTIK